MNPALLRAAIRNVESNIGSVVNADSDPNDINEEIFVLAFDAAFDAGASEDEAQDIASHVLESMCVSQ